MTAPSHAPLGRPIEPTDRAVPAEVSPALEDAVDRAGVAPGWWVTGVRHGSSVAHRLRLNANDARVRTTIAVCGRTVTRPEDAAGRRDSRSCGDCVTKAGRALPPGPLAPTVGPPPVTRRRDRAGTAEQPNTAAARAARRLAFRRSVMLPAGAEDYVPAAYGAGHSSAVVVRAPLT